MSKTDKQPDKPKGEFDDNRVVKSRIHRLDESVALRTKPYKFTPQELLKKVNKYFDECEKKDMMPSIKGMVIFLKMNRSTFTSYMHNDLFADILEQAKLVISEWCERDVYSTGGMAAGKIAYMKNVHSWADKLETNNYTEQRVLGVDEARAKIEMLAPKLLEVLKSNPVLSQLTHNPLETVRDEKDSTLHKAADIVDVVPIAAKKKRVVKERV